MARVRVTQIRSIIDRPEKQKRTIKALGLGRVNKAREHDDTPAVRGMIQIVSHLVKVEPVEA